MQLFKITPEGIRVIRKLIFFALFIFISMKNDAQVITTRQVELYADKLVKSDFLTAKGKAVLLDQVAKGEIEVEHRSTVKSIAYTTKKLSRETILQFCTSALLTELYSRLKRKRMPDDKILHKEPLDVSVNRSYSMMDFLGAKKHYADCISPKTSVVGYTRAKTLETFKNAGLIDEKVFSAAYAALQAKRIPDEIHLLEFLLEASTYYAYYDFNKKEQIDYIGSLVANGIIEEGRKEGLINSYIDGELKTIPEILDYSSRYIRVDLSGYERNPQVIYPVIFDNIQKLLPAFRYSRLEVDMLEEKERDLVRQDIRLSFSVDTMHYTHTFFHDYRTDHPEEETDHLELPAVDEDFHKGINKWLTDAESPFRLYTISTVQQDRRQGKMSIGLLLLKQNEDSLITREVDLISRESFDERLSKKNIDKMINEFRTQGFFNHLSATEMQDVYAKSKSAEINSIEDFLFRLPGLVVLFDWETGNLENPYEQITKELMAASRGGFTVTGIIDDYKKGWQEAKEVKYGFTMNGKRYEQMLKFDGDWLDPEFFALLKKAMSDNHVNGQFHYCIDNGQESGYIFLTATQYTFISEHYPDVLKDR